MLKKDDGSLESRHEWPKNGGKLKDAIVFNMNRDMHLRIVSKSNIILHFNSNRESAKIQLGSSNQISFDDMANVSFTSYFSWPGIFSFAVVFQTLGE